MAQPPARGAPTCCARTWPRSTTRSRRRAQVRGDLEFLRGAELLEYMAAVRARALEAPVTDGELHELVIRHELQHTETMLQAMASPA